MRKFFLALFLFSIFFQIVAQSTNEPNLQRNAFKIDTDNSGFYGSNCLSNKFLTTLLFGGKITEKDKNKIVSRLNEKNIFYFDSRYSIGAAWTIRNYHNVGFRLGQRYYANAIFSENFAKTALFGNSQWNNERVNLDEQQWNFLSYSFLSFNYRFNDFSLNENIKLSFAITGNLFLGNQYINLESKNGWIETTTLSQKLLLETQILFRQSTANTVNGFGGGADLQLSLKGNFRKGKWDLNILSQDLGYIKWDKKSLQLSQNYNFEFEGIAYNLMLNGDNEGGVSFLDSMKQTILDDVVHQKFGTLVPASLHLDANILFNATPTFFVGFSPFMNLTLFNFPIYRLGIAPSIEILQTKEENNRLLQFSLPISYSNLYGVGFGFRVGYEAEHLNKANTYLYRYRCFFQLAEISPRSGSCYGAISFSFFMKKN